MPLEDYKVLRRIAEGRFGTVFAATKLCDGTKVAIKKIRARRNLPGLDFDPWYKSAQREQEVLRVVRHENVVELIEHLVEPGATTAVLIYQYLAWDLATIAEKRKPLQEGHVKCVMKMLLTGVAYLHASGVMHRDLKPPNLLIDGSTGQLKIADFGSARFLPADDVAPTAAMDGGYALSEAEDATHGLMTRDVCTRWYKSPEMLFGSVDYSLGVDLWAVGCIFGELLSSEGQPLFAGGSDLEQLCFIFQAVGTPNEAEWPEVRQCPDYAKVAFKPKEPHRPKISDICSADSTGLIWGFLELNPKHRTTAVSALAHAFFLRGCPLADPRSLIEGLEEGTGHHHHEVNEGPMTPVSFCDFASDCSDLIYQAADDEFEPVGIETTACGLWDQAEEPATGRRTPSPPRDGVHRLKG